MSTTSDCMPADLAKFAFHCFIVVADADDAMGAREVERLHEILSSPPAAPAAFHDALEAARMGYADLWTEYRAGQFGKSTGSVESHWAVLRARLGDEAAPFASALLALLEDVIAAGSPVLARLGLAPNAKARALNVMRGILVGARASQAPAPQEPAAASPTEAQAPAGEAPRSDVSDLWPAAMLRIGEAPGWSRGRTRLRCVAVVPETHDVKSFHFVPQGRHLFTYLPGQFMTLDVPVDGKTVKRSYTISSSPSRPHALSITVKRVPDGLVSNWLHDNLRPGMEISVFGPNGEFTCLEAPAPKLLFLAAGSGITPLMSMLRWLSDTSSDCDVVFLDFVRSPQDVIFEAELAHCSHRMGGRLRLGVVPSLVTEGRAWNGPVGHVAPSLVQLYAPDMLEREVFVCGPGGFMEAVRQMLLTAGLAPERYHQESFGAAPSTAREAAAAKTAARASQPVAANAAPAPRANAAAAPRQNAEPAAGAAAVASEIVFAKSGKTVACTGDDCILEVAESNGIAMENSCRSGTCGTCKTIKLEGVVELEDQKALCEADLEAGFVLACVGRPKGRVVLDA